MLTTEKKYSGPDLHRTLTYFLGNANEKGDFASFFSNYVGLPIFQSFRHDFFYLIFYKFNPCFGIFFGGRNETHVYNFFVCKIQTLGQHIPVL